jgi:tetratricopeptide (TPR) repeat protein
MRLRSIIQNISLKNTLNNAAKAFRDNDFEKAEKFYLQVLDKDSENFEGQLWLGSLYSETEKYPKAIELLESAIALKPNDFQPYFNLGLLYVKMQRKELAFEFFERALKNCKLTKSRKAELFYNIGRLKIDLKEYGQAIDYANKALAIHPNYEQAEQIKMYAFQMIRK